MVEPWSQMTVQLSASQVSRHRRSACGCEMRMTGHMTCSLPWLTDVSNSSLQWDFPTKQNQTTCKFSKSCSHVACVKHNFAKNVNRSYDKVIFDKEIDDKTTTKYDYIHSSCLLVLTLRKRKITCGTDNTRNKTRLTCGWMFAILPQLNSYSLSGTRLCFK